MITTAVDDPWMWPPADQPGGVRNCRPTTIGSSTRCIKNGEIGSPTDELSTVRRHRAEGCLDYVEIAASATSTSPTESVTNQTDNVGINGDDVFYPAVSLDFAGDLIAVFDESSTRSSEHRGRISASTGTMLSSCANCTRARRIQRKRPLDGRLQQ